MPSLQSVQRAGKLPRLVLAHGNVGEGEAWANKRLQMAQKQALGETLAQVAPLSEVLNRAPGPNESLA